MDIQRKKINFSILMTLLSNEPIEMAETQESLYHLFQDEPDTIGLRFSTCELVLFDDGTWTLDHVPKSGS